MDIDPVALGMQSHTETLRWQLGSTAIEQVEVLRASLALLSSGAETEMATRTAG